MEIERRERDPDTGETMAGGGFGDVFGKIAAKLTGKTAKKLATKAAEKAAEKVGEKTGQLVGEKIYEKFATKPTTKPTTKSTGQTSAAVELKSSESENRPPETKGKEIGKMLSALSEPQPAKNEISESKFIKINNIYADLL